MEAFLSQEVIVMREAAPQPRSAKKRDASPAAPSSKFAAPTSAAEPVDSADPLLMDLKQLRRELADAAGVPAFHIFPNTTLDEMCRLRPETRADFLGVSGVGAVKLEKFGDAFLAVIQKHRSSTPNDAGGAI